MKSGARSACQSGSSRGTRVKCPHRRPTCLAVAPSDTELPDPRLCVHNTLPGPSGRARAARGALRGPRRGVGDGDGHAALTLQPLPATAQTRCRLQRDYTPYNERLYTWLGLQPRCAHSGRRVSDTIATSPT